MLRPGTSWMSIARLLPTTYRPQPAARRRNPRRRRPRRCQGLDPAPTYRQGSRPPGPSATAPHILHLPTHWPWSKLWLALWRIPHQTPKLLAAHPSRHRCGLLLGRLPGGRNSWVRLSSGGSRSRRGGECGAGAGGLAAVPPKRDSPSQLATWPRSRGCWRRWGQTDQAAFQHLRRRRVLREVDQPIASPAKLRRVGDYMDGTADSRDTL